MTSLRLGTRARQVLAGATAVLVFTDLATLASGALVPHGPRTALVAPTTRPVPATSGKPAGGRPQAERHPAPAVTPATTVSSAYTAPPTSPPPTQTGGGPAADPTPTNTCPATACVTLYASQSTGPVTHAASGLNINASSAAAPPYFDQIALRNFRSAPAPAPGGVWDWSEWNAAVAQGATTTIIVSNLWAQAHPGGPPPTPWSDWTAYDSWARTTTSRILASGEPVNYWDVYNEPGWNGYYSTSDYNSMTAQDLLQQFLHTYRDIKQIDPGAAIVGPSIGLWTLTPLPPDFGLTREPDLATFLRFCSGNGLQLAAVAWHMNGESPSSIETKAQATWNLIRSVPGIGDPLMFLDEYESSADQPIPGWDVGFMKVMNDENISAANRSCWDGCSIQTLNGLLTGNGQPTSEFYVNRTYASMSGNMFATSSTDPYLPAIGAVDGSQVVALLGRDRSCVTAAWCEGSGWTYPRRVVPPESVHVTVVLPWASPRVNVSLGLDSFDPGVASSGPLAVRPANLTLRPGGTGGEVLSFDIPGFGDGSAYSLTITPAG